MSTDIFIMFHVLQLMILSFWSGRQNKFRGIVGMKTPGFISPAWFLRGDSSRVGVWGRTGAPFFSVK